MKEGAQVTPVGNGGTATNEENGEVTARSA
jgi:hypothetical protein